MVIKKATIKDYDQLCKLFTEVDEIHRIALPEIFKKPDGSARTKEYFQDLLKDKNVLINVVEEESQLVGFIHAYIKGSPNIPIMVSRKYGVIENLAVTKKFQGQGIGRKLMESAHEWFKDFEIKSIELNVWEFNQKAIGFYEKLGYQALSRKMGKKI